MPTVRRKICLFGLILGALLPALPAWGQEPAPAPAASAESEVKSGIATGSKGDIDGAIAAFNEAIKIDPKYAPAYANRGYAESLQQKLNEAVADYDQAVRLDPNYLVAYYNRGAIKGQKGDFDGAIADFNRAIELNPKYAAAYYNRGHCKYFKGDLAGAAADLDQSITLNPGFPVGYYIRGLVAHALGNGDAGTADFQKSGDLGFGYGAVWLWIVQMEKGDHDAARTNLSISLSKAGLFRPGDWVTQVGNFLLDKITPDQLMAKAREGTGDQAQEQLCEALFYIGTAKLFSGDTKGAQDSFLQAVASGPKDSEEWIEAHREAAKLPKP